MSASGTQVTLTLDAGPGADAPELAQLAQQVRAGLLALDPVVSAELVRSGPAPAGTRAGDVIDLGKILLGLIGTGGLTSIIGYFLNWLGRREGRKVTIENRGRQAGNDGYLR